jgi:hypothetical protein
METILTTANNNGFPAQIKHNLKKKLETKTQQQQHNKKWVTFTYHSASIRKITNLFKATNLRIAMKITNTVLGTLRVDISVMRLAAGPCQGSGQGRESVRCV